MGKLIYDEISVTDFKNTVNECNNEMLNAIKNISNEVENIEETLKTPKSVITTSSYNEYFKSKVKYLNSTTSGFDTLFNDIINTYQDKFNMDKAMVGGNTNEL